MSTDSLFDEHWYRVKHLKPRLAGDVVIRRHVYRNVPCYVLHRQSNSGFHRAGGRTFEIIGKLDGTYSVDELWSLALATQGEDAPTQSEIMSLLAQLHETELITVNRRLNAERLFSRGEADSRKERQQRYLNPLFLRFKLFDPNALLDRIAPASGWLFTKLTAMLWIVLILLALMELIPKWSVLRYEISTIEFFSPFYAVMFFCIYPLLKLLHEFSHGLAVKHLNGEVHEVGIALMVLLPIPYVDASAAGIFSDKYQRILVGAVGIIVELGLAAVATLIWVSSTGPLHDVALIVMLIGGLSTVLFNANPLLKFDGYYILADWLEIPNLADKSRQYFQASARALLFGMPNEGQLPQDAGEKRWLISYAILSGLYRIGLMLSIAYMLAGKFFFFGVLLALWIVATLLIKPMWRYLMFVNNQTDKLRSRILLVSGGIAGAVAVLLLVIPIPYSTTGEGVVWLPEQAVVRVASECEITKQLVDSGDTVTVDQPLFLCENSTLEADAEMLQAQLDELSAKTTGLDVSNRIQRLLLKNESESIQASLSRTQEKLTQQLVIARIDGQFIKTDGAMLEGRYFEQGAVAAYIVPPEQRTVRLAIDDSDIGALYAAVDRVEMRFAEQTGRRTTYTSNIQRQTPKASTNVPSVALTIAGGGRLVADPAGDGTTVLDPVFDVELGWPESAPAINIGSHVQVKFVHASTPVAGRILTSIRRAFLGRLAA